MFVTLWHFSVEHFKSDDVDEHDPDWAVQQVLFVLDERDCRDALGFQLPPEIFIKRMKSIKMQAAQN